MTPDQLSTAITGALGVLADDGVVRLPAGPPPRVVIERRQQVGQGDYATAVALKLAKQVGRPPRELAELLAERLQDTRGIESVAVAGPGFLNVSVVAASPMGVALEAVNAGPSYGRDRESAGARLYVERVEECPIGSPMHDVQYAHARAAALLRNGADLGLAPASADEPGPQLLVGPREEDLLRAVRDFASVAEAFARLNDPRRLARHLEDAALAFHAFHGSCRVLPWGDDTPLPVHAARLLLVDATRVVLANGLDLLGVSAPERM